MEKPEDWTGIDRYDFFAAPDDEGVETVKYGEPRCGYGMWVRYSVAKRMITLLAEARDSVISDDWQERVREFLEEVGE